jgi:GAF domain-containing protein
MPEEAGPQPATAAGINNLGGQHGKAGERKKQIADGESVTDLRQQVLRLQGQLDERTAELRERTVALNDAIEQQSAATEVLQVINSSPGDLTPVFDAMLEKGVQLCEASFGLLMTYDGECFHTVALHGVPEAYAAFLREPIRPAPQNGLGRLLSDERLIHIADITADDAYRLGDPLRVATADLGGSRTHLVVPLLKDSSVLGVIVAYRQEVRPFTEKQIALLQNFAAQAVIAMENARLITETREALEQQTATAAILRVISNSPTDVQPTFDAIVASAATLCEAEFSAVVRFEDGLLHLVATNNLSANEAAAFYSLFPRPPQPNFVLGRAFLEGRPVQFEDVLADADYDARIRQVLQSKLGYRTFMAVPILRAGVPIGVVGCGRRRVQPFTTNQIDLLNTFAEQAAIALDNVRLFNELSARNRDLTEALEYQTATSDVLKIISQSGANIEPVLQTVVEMAARLCEADKAVVGHLSDGLYRMGASVGFSEEYKDYRSRSPIPLDGGTAIGRMILDRRAVHIEDAAADPDYTDSVARDLGQFRTVLSVPMKREEAVVGGIFLARSRVEPFTDKQIALVATFADQAAIAIENARLITETREALEQQTATAEVLGVINASPGDLAPVFDAMLEKAMRLCGALFGELRTYDGERFLLAATHGTPAAYIEYYRRHDTGRYAAGTGPARLLAGEGVVHIPDLIATEPYQRGDPDRRAIVDIAGARAYVLVPLLLNEAVRGFILIYRQEARPFTEKQIALLQNFAAQAVIAIENTRLITETKEALDQQTATAEVLQVINSSPGDLAPVFEAMLDKAMRLCEAVFGFLTTYDGQNFRPAAQKGGPEALAEYFTAGMDQPRPGDAHSRLLDGEDLIHNDQKDEDAYRSGNPLRRAVVDLGGARTALVVALRKDGVLLGALTIYRQEVRPFSDKQIALLQNFAAQAVIAIENARLLGETREALEQQTATAEVLRVINSSPGDIRPVFEAMLERAARLCSAGFGSLWIYEGEQFRAAAVHAVPAALADFVREPVPADDSASLAEIVRGQSVVHLPDLADSELYRAGNPVRRAYVDLGGARTLLSVALRKDDSLLGAFNIYRQEVRPFSDQEIRLVENFAAQAVIAMENARLISETQEALEQQTATAEVLQVINASPGDLTPVFEAMLDKARRLCEATFGTLWTYDGEYMHAAAVLGAAPRYTEFLRAGPHPPSPIAHQPLLRGAPVVHIPDVSAHEGYQSGLALPNALVDLGGVRTLLAVPLRKDRALLGVFSIYRDEVRPFSEKQIAPELRCAGGHCDGERAAHYGNTGSPGAADRDGRDLVGHQCLARASLARLRGDLGKGAQSLRGHVWQFAAL